MIPRHGLHPSRWFRSVIGIATAIALFLVSVGPVSADGSASVFHCGSGHRHWATPSVTFSRPGTWPSATISGIDGAANDITSHSVFTWARVSSGTVPWANLNNPDTSVAGSAEPIYGLDCIIDDGRLWINFPHINAAAHSTGQRQCIAIHEYGHIMNFADVTSGTTIMLQPHSLRCHGVLISTLKTRDINDLALIY